MAMLFSEAIRLGAMIRPQAFFYLYDPANQGSCALGAAAEAVGILDHELNDYTGRGPREWKPVAFATTTCPECDEAPYGDECQEIVKHLNNHHRWSRERIADWVATIEARVLVNGESAKGDGDAVEATPIGRR